MFLPGKSHGYRGLVGYSPWDGKELDTTEHSTAHVFLDSGIENNKLLLHIPFTRSKHMDYIFKINITPSINSFNIKLMRTYTVFPSNNPLLFSSYSTRYIFICWLYMLSDITFETCKGILKGISLFHIMAHGKPCKFRKK